MNISAFLDTLTLGEVEYYETEVGEPIGDVYDKGFIAKSTMVLFYLHKKRTDETYTREQTRDVNPVAAIAELEAYNPKATPEA